MCDALRRGMVARTLCRIERQLQRLERRSYSSIVLQCTIETRNPNFSIKMSPKTLLLSTNCESFVSFTARFVYSHVIFMRSALLPSSSLASSLQAAARAAAASAAAQSSSCSRGGVATSRDDEAREAAAAHAS